MIGWNPFLRLGTSVVNVHDNHPAAGFQHPMLFSYKFFRLTEVHHRVGITHVECVIPKGQLYHVPCDKMTWKV